MFGIENNRILSPTPMSFPHVVLPVPCGENSAHVLKGLRKLVIIIVYTVKLKILYRVLAEVKLVCNTKQVHYMLKMTNSVCCIVHELPT